MGGEAADGDEMSPNGFKEVQIVVNQGQAHRARVQHNLMAEERSWIPYTSSANVSTLTGFK